MVAMIIMTTAIITMKRQLLLNSLCMKAMAGMQTAVRVVTEPIAVLIAAKAQLSHHRLAVKNNALRPKNRTCLS
jgi:hypothetical protein